jgi:hypothetical protein
MNTSGCKVTSTLVNQLPRYDSSKTVYDRRLKVHRPRKTPQRKAKYVK